MKEKMNSEDYNEPRQKCIEDTALDVKNLDMKLVAFIKEDTFFGA